MQEAGLKPDEETLLKVMCSCRRMGSINQSCVLLKSMIQDHGIFPTIKHYNAIVDLLGHAGLLNEALDLLESISMVPDVVGWTCLLSMCRKYGNVPVGRICFDRIVVLERGNAAPFVLMSSIYTYSGLKKDTHEVEELRCRANAWKKPGKAYTQINGQIHSFNVGDRSHSETNAIYAKLNSLSIEMKDHGYEPQVDFLLDKNSEDIESLLCGHCEKLAIAFGLISSTPGTTLRVSKNFLMCADCHLATKFISKIEMRDIIVSRRILYSPLPRWDMVL